MRGLTPTRDGGATRPTRAELPVPGRGGTSVGDLPASTAYLHAPRREKRFETRRNGPSAEGVRTRRSVGL
jgi:hypothetical protein